MNRCEGTPISTVSPFRARNRVGANQVSYSVRSTTCSKRSRTCRQRFMDGEGLYLSENPQVFHSCGKSFCGIGGRSLVTEGRWMQAKSDHREGENVRHPECLPMQAWKSKGDSPIVSKDWSRAGSRLGWTMTVPWPPSSSPAVRNKARTT